MFNRAIGFWRPRDRYQPAAGDDRDEDRRQGHQLNSTQRGTNRDVEANPPAIRAVDRNTSIRSVMTLPAYRQTAGNNEQVLGREGERDGVDVIVDLPDVEEDEALRDQEMETMYQMRVARRQQIAEREERRQQRREARERHDHRALAELRDRQRASSNSTVINDLRQDVDRIKEARQRSVSSVSYADVGLARHDGTRVRANSGESERAGLLSDAASIAVSARSGARTPSYHQRDRSGSSAVSIESDISIPTATRSRGNSQTDARTWDGRSRAGSSPELVEADLGDEAMPPPEYEDVPSDARSTTPMDEPPPDYPGPYRSASQRTSRNLTLNRQDGAGDGGPEGHERRTSTRGVGGTPQLPSLRISQLPEIVIEPSSAHPRDDTH